MNGKAARIRRLSSELCDSARSYWTSFMIDGQRGLEASDLKDTKGFLVSFLAPDSEDPERREKLFLTRGIGFGGGKKSPEWLGRILYRPI